MKISNVQIKEQGKQSNQLSSLFKEMLNLQSEYQMRVSDESLRYLRRLQGIAAPATPGTVVIPKKGTLLSGSGSFGKPIEINLEIENIQKSYSYILPMLTPLISPSGVTWYAIADYLPANLLIPPNSSKSLRVILDVPSDLPSDVYHGSLTLEGFLKGALPVAVTIQKQKNVKQLAKKPAPKPLSKRRKKP